MQVLVEVDPGLLPELLPDELPDELLPLVEESVRLSLPPPPQAETTAAVPPASNQDSARRRCLVRSSINARSNCKPWSWCFIRQGL
jgi:hypothetical protein